MSDFLKNFFSDMLAVADTYLRTATKHTCFMGIKNVKLSP
jgi:hypothetical protein